MTTNPNLASFKLFYSAGNEVGGNKNLDSLHTDCNIAKILDGPVKFTMTAFNTHGNESPHSLPFTANRTPMAAIKTGDLNRSVYFDASGSTAPVDGSIASYSWNLGDSNEIVNTDPTVHTFQPGEYKITLEVTDSPRCDFKS